MPNQLELIAIQQRNILLGINIYKNNNVGNLYSVTHSRAIADTQTPEFGKGTNDNTIRSAAENYNAGSATDRNGNTSIPGSGRNAAFGMNTYNPNNTYQTPIITP